MRREAVTASVCVLMIALSSFVILIPDLTADDGSLPSSFDQREYGIVTPPKYQNPWDTCWAFGGAGAAETAILKTIDNFSIKVFTVDDSADGNGHMYATVLVVIIALIAAVAIYLRKRGACTLGSNNRE